MRVTIPKSTLALAIISSALLTGEPAPGAESILPPASDQAQQPASAQPAADQGQEPAARERVFKDVRPIGESLVLQVSQGTVLRLPGDARTLFVADAEVADVQLSLPDVVLVTARKAGATAIYALDSVGNILMNRFIEVRGAVTVIRGAKIDTGAPPAGPMVLMIPLQPAAAPAQR